MKIAVFLFSLLCLYISSAQSAVSNEVNPDIVLKNVDRVIDIASQVTKINYKIVLENTGSTNVQSFDFLLEPGLKKAVSFFNAEGGEVLKSTLTADQIVTSGTEDTPTWRIQLKESLKPKSSTSIDIEVILTGILSPYPEQITQKEKQLVQYFGNHHIYSPYKVTSQKTTLQLGTRKVESFSKLNPTSQIDTHIVYGPYKNVGPLSINKLSVHYENNSPFLVASSLVRTIEVSHWGNVAVEEEIELVHAGAKLKGSFSRYEYQRESSSGQSSVKSFKTILPAAASDVYYRDEIGNISTSNYRVLADAVEVDLRPRFPLFGGWKTLYTLGYNLPSYEYLFKDEKSHQYVLKIRFIDHIYDEMIVRQAKVKIILPEHATDIKVHTPFPVSSRSDSTHATYLDTSGRPVVILTAENLVENHIQDVEITYEFQDVYIFKEPLLVAGALLTLFFTMMVCVRLDFSLAKKEKAK